MRPGGIIDLEWTRNEGRYTLANVKGWRVRTDFKQIFRAHLWQKIHESVVMGLCQVLGTRAFLGLDF